MRSGNNIHVQQRKTNMINEEWNKTQNDVPFVPFYDMPAVTFVLPDEMADVSIARLQCFILIPLPDKPILGSSNSAANKDTMSKIWKNGDTII